ncbi:MAG: response regulator transcription factor [Gammaproteobacteria bacterium]|nr:response regulator transcription factor [Gammaproteobacteria bacterium]
MKILLIEDDKDAAAYLSKGLVESGFSVAHADNGDDGLHMALASDYDVLLVDRMLPGHDGLSIIVMLRAGGDRTPALVLSALGEVDDRVAGLKAGGDDYMVKPYAFSELLARLEALVRRAQPQIELSQLEVADLVLDLKTHRVTRSGKRIHLRPREFRLLEFFMQHHGQVVTRTMLLEKVWGYSFDPHTNVIDVHISRLRIKIDKGFEPPLLHTVRGAGYKLSASP